MRAGVSARAGPSSSTRGAIERNGHEQVRNAELEPEKGCDNPRLRRTNWKRVAQAGARDPGFAVASHHHLCRKCYEAPARAMLLAECRNTPSQRLVKRRVDHPCAVCECTVQRGERSWNCTVPGPRTFRVCVDCIDETRRDRDNDADGVK